MADFIIAHMYPDLMNLYSDRGNLMCLEKRLNWYGYSCEIILVSPGNNSDYKNIDMLFMGSGSEREQGLVYQELMKTADQLKASIEDGLPALFIAGAYQLLGNSYIDCEGNNLGGLGFFDFYTRSLKERLTGNILINTILNKQELSVVGFENHGGRTYFEDSKLKPFGTVISGYGNNGEDKTEGIIYNNLIGTYLHGPLLPKNPTVADFFIKAMALRKGIEIMSKLNDDIEAYAHEQVKNKILSA